MEYNWTLAMLLMLLIIVISGEPTIKYIRNTLQGPLKEGFTFELNINEDSNNKLPESDKYHDPSESPNLAALLRGVPLSEVEQEPEDTTPDIAWSIFKKPF